MMTSKTLRRRSKPLLLLCGVAFGLPALMIGRPALADSLSISVSYGKGHHHKHHWHRHHVRHFHPPHRFHHHHYVYRRPVVVYRSVVVDRPVVMPYPQSCTNGLWRQIDGTLVEGVACRQPDGTWRLEP